MGRDAEYLGAVATVEGNDVGDLGTAECDGARFVEDDDADGKCLAPAERVEREVPRSVRDDEPGKPVRCLVEATRAPVLADSAGSG